MIEPPTIAWPALLRYRGESDLMVVESWEQWVQDTDLSAYEQAGELVASDGAVFDLVFVPTTGLRKFFGETGFLQPVATGERLDAGRLVAFVRPHVEAHGADAVGNLEALAVTHDGLAAAVVSLIRALHDAERG